ncbi:MAG: TIGR02453 family protein [Acidobacteriota bacterium]|nr:MAG: TIGR02453 family protein [Acidobacteriota bacterium]
MNSSHGGEPREFTDRLGPLSSRRNARREHRLPLALSAGPARWCYHRPVPAGHFLPELFTFFVELAAHNSRDWFQQHKARYETVVRDPLLAFIEEFGPRLAAVSRHFRAAPRPVGGSLFRIQRETRFSRDKSPFKTHAGIQFRHASASRDVHAPGFYIHLAPGQVFVARGIWRPNREALAAIREALVAKPAVWRRVRRTLDGRGFRLSGESLKTVPRAFDREHPFAEDLKRKDLVTVREASESDACRPGFIDRVADAFEEMSPLASFVTRAVGLPW